MLYTVAVEHFIQVALYIRRGATHADACVHELRPVLHCQMCEEWAVCPDTHAPVGAYYSQLSHVYLTARGLWQTSFSGIWTNAIELTAGIIICQTCTHTVYV